MLTALVVDTDDVLRAALQRDLQQRNYQVLATASAEDALAELGQRQFDLLIADMRLGTRTGLELIRTAKRHAPGTATILLAGAPTSRDYEAAERLGSRVLSKPFSKGQFQAALSRVLDGRGGMRGSLDGLSLMDVLQMLHLARRTIALNTFDGQQPGVILLEDGEIIHAERAPLKGELALRYLLAQSNGTMGTGPFPTTPQRTISRSFDLMVLDSLRENDESGPPALPPPRPSMPSWDESDEEPTRSSLLPTSEGALPIHAPMAAATPIEAAPAMAEHWFTAAREVAGAGAIFGMAIELSSGQAHCFGSTPRDLIGADQLRGLVEHLEALNGEKAGCAEFAGPSGQMSVVWNRARSMALLLAPTARATNRLAEFRAATMAAGRAALEG